MGHQPHDDEKSVDYGCWVQWLLISWLFLTIISNEKARIFRFNMIIGFNPSKQSDAYRRQYTTTSLVQINGLLLVRSNAIFSTNDKDSRYKPETVITPF